MARLKTYEEFVNENIGAALGSPIKYTKIKNNMKKYQKSLVQKALNDLDYQKKKEKAGDLTADQKEKLKLAKDAKNKAVDSIVDLTSQRIDDLATNDKLKKVASLGKTKSKLAANKVILKSADGDMKAALKKKEADLQTKVTKLTQDVKSDVKDKKGSTKDTIDTPPPVKSDKDNKGGTPTDSGESTAEIKKKQDAAKQKMKDQTDAAKDKMDKEVADNKGKMDKKGKDDKEGGIGRLDYVSPNEDEPEEINYEFDIKALNKNIEDERTAMKKAEKELEQAKRDAKVGRGSEDEIQKIEKRIEDSKEDIAEMKKREAEAKKKAAAEVTKKKDESFEYVAESVAQKFARLRSTNENVNEGNKYSVHYSDGMRSGKEFKKESDAMQFAKDIIKNKKGLQFVSVHKPGMYQTADKKDLLAWWGPGSYWDNVSKKDKDIIKLKIN